MGRAKLARRSGRGRCVHVSRLLCEYLALTNAIHSRGSVALSPCRAVCVGLAFVALRLMLGRSREKFKKSFKTMASEIEHLRVLVADLREFVSELRCRLSPIDQDLLKDKFELFQ